MKRVRIIKPLNINNSLIFNIGDRGDVLAIVNNNVKICLDHWDNNYIDSYWIPEGYCDVYEVKE